MTQPKKIGRPKKDNPLKQKSIRVDPDRWELAKRKSEKQGNALNDIIRLLLDAWIDDDLEIEYKFRIKSPSKDE